MKGAIRLCMIFLIGAVSRPGYAGWSRVGSPAIVRLSPTATLLADGRVLVAGGAGDETSAELYDPMTRTYSRTRETMAVSHPGHASTLLRDGRVLISGGGFHPRGDPATGPSGTWGGNANEIFDPPTQSFTRIANLGFSRAGHTATLLDDGRVLIAGGEIVDVSVFSIHHFAVPQAELYDPVTGAFTETGSLLTARARHTASRLPDGRVLVVGGDASGPEITAEIYDPISATFSPAGSMMGRRMNHTATVLLNGDVFVAGGKDPSTGYALDSAEIFDVQRMRFVPAATMPEPRDSHVAALMPDGRVLIAGGEGIYPTRELRSAILYDPPTDRFLMAPSMSTARFQATATTLTNGQVLVVGGWSSALGSFDPIASELFESGALPSKRRAVR
jgi:hypothetical protein